MTVQSFRDQLGCNIDISIPVKRIISLVPSQTELLFDLGLSAEVIGITKFCIHPAHWIKEKEIIGGTKNFHFDKIDSLKPDLIIANKEENFKEGIEKLKEKHPVWTSDITDLVSALEMITMTGSITGKIKEADQIAASIKKQFATLKPRPSLKVLYLIWRKPWMAAGLGTFINSMIELTGWKNALTSSRYPELSDEDIRAMDPDVIFLSSEPYPFKEKHISELTSLLPSARVILVDGEMFSWYGSRLIKAPAYINAIEI